MTTLEAVVAASTGPGTFIGWGPVTISLGNLVVIATMLVLFAAALVLPFPKDRARR